MQYSRARGGLKGGLDAPEAKVSTQVAKFGVTGYREPVDLSSVH